MKNTKVTTKEYVTLESLSQQMSQGFADVSKRFDETDKSIEDLAVITAKEFKMVYKKFDDIDKKIGSMNKRIDYNQEVNLNKMQAIDRRIDNLAYQGSTREEVKALDYRLLRVEKKVGLVK